VAGRFSIQPLGGPDRHDPWLRIGTVDIGTSALAAILSAIGLVAYSLAPSALLVLALSTTDVSHGMIWQLVTWPIPNYPSLWAAISIAMLWYFGLQLERTVGRFRMAFFLVAMTFVLGLLAVGLQALLFGTGTQLYGISEISLMVFLTFIAEHPHARFFFNIPAWVIGLVYVGISLLSFIAARDGLGLAVFVIGLVLVALLAKAIGLLDEVEWLPTLRLGRRTRAPRPARSTGSGGRRPGRKAGRTASGPKVVKGPWGSSTEKDQAEFDALLDKISATGMASLTPAEVRRLHALRDKLRGH